MSVGSKFVIKRLDDNTRKQFLILGGEVILAFVQRAGRFSQCASYRDITSEVDCQVRRDSNCFISDLFPFTDTFGSH